MRTRFEMEERAGEQMVDGEKRERAFLVCSGKDKFKLLV